MEQPPGIQGDPPVPLTSILKEETWEGMTSKLGSATNPRLLLFTVEYIDESGNPGVDLTYPGSPRSESSSTCAYDNLILSRAGQLQDSVVMVPDVESTNSAHFSILVDPAEQLILDPRLYQDTSPPMEQLVNGVSQNRKVIIATADFSTASSGTPIIGDVLVPPLVSSVQFFQGDKEEQEQEDLLAVEPMGDSYSPTHSPDTGLLGEPSSTLLQMEGDDSKGLSSTTEFELKQELLLSTHEQGGELLLKPECLMEVDEYNLGREEDSEYLMSGMLQSNMEVFESSVLGSSSWALLCDKAKQQQQRGRKHPYSSLGIDYWCEDCADTFGVECPKHQVKVISDKPVLSRARATLPKEHLSITNLPDGSALEGVFARKTIPKRVQFGPVEGIIREITAGEPARELELLLEVESGEMLRLDVTDEDESNWMRFVRPAKSIKEQNLVLTQQGRSLYFTTTKQIPPRHELRVGYSVQYAERRKLLVLHPTTAQQQQHLLGAHDVDKELEDISNKTNKKKPKKGGVERKQAVVSPDSEMECWNCHKVFPRTYSFKRHMMRIHGEDIGNKENKKQTLVDKDTADRSKYIVANTLFKKRQCSGARSEWLCTQCNLTFDNPSVLNLHTLTHAAEDLETEVMSGVPSELLSAYHDGEFLVESGDVQCPQCTQEFRTKHDLIHHASTHGKTARRCCAKGKVVAIITQPVEENPRPFKCDRCYKSFATETRLQRHMLVHGADETKPYQCGTCTKRFLNNSALSCHLKTHCDKKSFECPICKEEFEQILGLKEHVKTHSSDGIYTCPHCAKAFDGYSMVRKHVRAFHSGLQHVCKECGKICPTLDKLRMHSLRHSDHREFLCANCGKQFKRKDKLKEHMKRMHSVEREAKYLSSTLRMPNGKDRRFTPKTTPLAYDRFIYKCRKCMLGFKRRGMLVNHLAKRHPDIVPDTVPELSLPILKTTRDYFCQYCDKIYKSSSKRKAHILKNHPGAELPMSNRQKGGVALIPGVPNPTYSQTVGSVKTAPHGCQWCHKQYASKAKLLQHQRKKHTTLLPQAQQLPRLTRSLGSPSSDLGDSQLQPHIMRRGPVFTLKGEVTSALDIKPLKVLADGLPCDLLSEAMVELTQSLAPDQLAVSLQPYPPR